MKVPAPVVAACLLGLSEPASAHLVSTRFGELYSGLMHPLTALQHLVPWLGLGLLGGLLGSHTSRWVLLAFPLSVGVGALLAGMLPAAAAINHLNLFSFVLLGVLVALATRLNRPTFIGLAVIVGLSHGFANGTADLDGVPLLLYASGVLLAAYIVIATATAMTHTLSQRTAWGTIAIRAAGSWIVAIGLVFSGYSLISGLMPGLMSAGPVAAG